MASPVIILCLHKWFRRKSVCQRASWMRSAHRHRERINLVNYCYIAEVTSYVPVFPEQWIPGRGSVRPLYVKSILHSWKPRKAQIRQLINQDSGLSKHYRENCKRMHGSAKKANRTIKIKVSFDLYRRNLKAFWYFLEKFRNARSSLHFCPYTLLRNRWTTNLFPHPIKSSFECAQISLSTLHRDKSITQH